MMTLPNDEPSIPHDDAAAAAVVAANSVAIPSIKDEDPHLHHQYVQHHPSSFHHIPPPAAAPGVNSLTNLVGVAPSANSTPGVTTASTPGIVPHPASAIQHHQFPSHAHPHITHSPSGHPHQDPEDQLNAQLSHQLNQHAAAAAAAAAHQQHLPPHYQHSLQQQHQQHQQQQQQQQQQQHLQHPLYHHPHQPLPGHAAVNAAAAHFSQQQHQHQQHIQHLQQQQQQQHLHNHHHLSQSPHPHPLSHQHQQQLHQQQLHQQQLPVQHAPGPQVHSITSQHPSQQSSQSHTPRLHGTPNLQNPQLNQAAQHHLDMLTQNPSTNASNTPNDDDYENGVRKVAPRSSDLFRVGPQFSDNRHHQKIFCRSTDMEVTPILDARIDRGFEMGEHGTWIGYKRNYFTLVSSFSFEHFDFNRFMANKYYTYDTMKNEHGQDVDRRAEISYFAIRLTPKCSDDDVSISLVQHTAKRDKGPQFPPPIYPAVPGDLPEHEVVKASCNKRNGQKIENMNKVFYFDRADYYQSTNLDEYKDGSMLRNYPSDSIARVARFERIQFTSSIRVKSTSINSRYFTLEVGLLGIVQDEHNQIQPILLSSIETPPLIIRGRSPSNYHKDRTSGYRTSLG